MADKPVCPLDDRDLIAACLAEMERSVGFENDQELRDDREQALNYSKGEMPDVPSLPNRSKAVSSDIADQVETILPDLMEIFGPGEDPVAFIPNKQEDEEAAEQETQYLGHVIFQDNPGFLNLYNGFKDGLLLKTCLFKYWWDEKKEVEEEKFVNKNAVEVTLASQDGEVSNVEVDEETGLYSFTLTKTSDLSAARFEAVGPEDFSVSPDTVRLSDTAYCVHRSRPRVQDLIADGYDESVVRSLPLYSTDDEDTIEYARDVAGEHLTSNSEGDDSTDDLKQVEIREHYIRLLHPGGKLGYWRVVTDSQCTVLIEKDWAPRVPFAAGSPYIRAHRFYGESLADKLAEVMRIKTVLLRMGLDSGYFALNQRMELPEAAIGDNTLSDLMRNEPMVPVRTKGAGGMIRPLTAGSLNFDVWGAYEQMSVIAEQRTGVVRNAQGLNPDTLHDTATGAMALMGQAQKRVRMIARILAETCLKDLYLGLHAIIRENASAERIVKLSGKWVPVNPSKWTSRNAMTIEVGLGASGKDIEIGNLRGVLDLQMKAIELQGGAQGPLVTLKDVYNASSKLISKMGFKDQFVSDPESEEARAAIQEQANKPDPEVAKIQAQAQAKQAEAQINGQFKAAEMQQQAEYDRAKLEAETAANAEKLAMEAQMRRYQIDAEMALKREQLQAELMLKRDQLAAELALKRELGMANAMSNLSVNTSEVALGGDPG